MTHVRYENAARHRNGGRRQQSVITITDDVTPYIYDPNPSPAPRAEEGKGRKGQGNAVKPIMTHHMMNAKKSTYGIQKPRGKENESEKEQRDERK